MPTLGLRGTLRCIWTQLSSMRTALMLLLLLAVAAVPGSVFPQRRAGSDIVETWIEDNPTLGPILDAMGMFDVYNSVWFSAVYLLLVVSLVGCLWPRGLQHLKLVSDDVEYTNSIKCSAANIAVAIMSVAVLAHAFAVIARTIAASGVPWSNLYGFMTSGALVISVVYLVFPLRKRPALRRHLRLRGRTADDGRHHHRRPNQRVTATGFLRLTPTASALED